MARVVEFILCYQTELKNVARGHHVYQLVWASTVGEKLFTAPDKKGEALSYDEFAIGVFKDEKCSLLVRHLLIEISNFSLCLMVKVMKKRGREIGLVDLANFVYITKDKSCSIILEPELEKRKTLFQDLKLKFYKKGVY